MVTEKVKIRVARLSDLAAVDRLFSVSYPALLKADYAPSVYVTALPIISRAQPRLLASGSYYLAMDNEEVVGAGGWTRSGPRTADVRHLVSDLRRQRQGIGRALMEEIFTTARASGIRRLKCQATFTAVPFYKAMGFTSEGAVTIPLRPGITFPAMAMERGL
ncbi:MAG: GNAT family N-acetyltransferase [Pseudomonadota bacterium]